MLRRLVLKMSIISNVMGLNGVKITDILQLLVLFRITSMNSVRMGNLFIKDVKLIMLVLVVISDIRTLALPVKS